MISLLQTILLRWLISCVDVELIKLSTKVNDIPMYDTVDKSKTQYITLRTEEEVIFEKTWEP